MKTKELIVLIDGAKTILSQGLYQALVTSAFRQECVTEEDIVEDSVTLSEAYISWYLLWADIIGNAVPELVTDECLFKRQTLLRWAHEMCVTDPGLLFTSLEDLDTSLRISPYADVLRQLSVVVRGLPLPCKNRYISFLDRQAAKPDDASYYQIREVRTLCCFLSRLNLTCTSAKPLDKWLATEKRLTDLKISKFDLMSLQTCAGSLELSPLSRMSLSKGSTADAGVSVIKKCRATAGANRYSHRVAFKHGLSWPTTKVVVAEPTSRMIFVPKSWKTQRTIVMEPAYQAAMQNSIGKSMSNAVHRLWKSKVNPSDPSHNRKLTSDDRYATIDLSEASDSVRWDVALAVAGQYRSLIKASRTTSVNITDGSKVELVKAAGMGNAWTFPLECHVFATIVELARRRGGFPAADFGVYGDDIIVPVEWYDTVVETLSIFGFIPNVTKSYSREYDFRESCGFDYYFVNHKPYFVTPFRLSRRFDSSIRWINEPKLLQRNFKDAFGLVSLANEALMLGYQYCYRYYADVLRRCGAKFSDGMIPVLDPSSHKPRFVFTGLFSLSATVEQPAFSLITPAMEQRIGAECLAWALSSDTAEYADIMSENCVFQRVWRDGKIIIIKPARYSFGITFSQYPWVILGDIPSP